MGSLALHIVVGVVLVLVLDHFSLLAGTFAIPSGSAINSDVVTSMKRADHSGKGNRLVSPRPENSRTRIGTVEIVGLRDTAIVYRDREGRILFRNDPLTNTTIVTKNVDLPEVTVRDPDGIAARPVPVEAPPRADRPRPPVGCDPSFGPLADPSLRGLTGRCLTSTASVQTFAALR
jgi:hypothetical protein